MEARASYGVASRIAVARVARVARGAQMLLFRYKHSLAWRRCRSLCQSCASANPGSLRRFGLTCVSLYLLYVATVLYVMGADNNNACQVVSDCWLLRFRYHWRSNTESLARGKAKVFAREASTLQVCRTKWPCVYFVGSVNPFPTCPGSAGCSFRQYLKTARSAIHHCTLKGRLSSSQLHRPSDSLRISAVRPPALSC